MARPTAPHNIINSGTGIWPGEEVRKEMRHRVPLTATAVFLLLSAIVLAQSGGGYDLSWWTVDGGGGTVSGGGYALSGTAGQPDAGPSLTGSGYALYGGFWPGGGAASPTCPNPLTGVSISGPSSGNTEQTLTFTASPDPADATTPITYTWSTDGLVSGQGTATATYRWNTAGTKTVQVTASNCGGSANASHSIEITSAAEHKIYLPFTVRN